jgi:hypothetical protein
MFLCIWQDLGLQPCVRDDDVVTIKTNSGSTPRPEGLFLQRLHQMASELAIGNSFLILTSLRIRAILIVVSVISTRSLKMDLEFAGER